MADPRKRPQNDPARDNIINQIQSSKGLERKKLLNTLRNYDTANGINDRVAKEDD